MSVCGRKVVSWSKTILATQLKHYYKRHNGASTIECYFDGISHSLHTLLEQYKDIPEPRQCAVYARSVPFDYLLGKQDFSEGSNSK